MVKNKIPNVSNLDTKVLEIHSRKFSTSDFNKFTRNIPDAIIKKGLVGKSAISGLKNNTVLNQNIATLATKSTIKA